jgi:hypothetical protein
VNGRFLPTYTCVLRRPPDLTNSWLHGVFLLESTNSSHTLLSACMIARHWLLEKVNAMTDLQARVRNIIGRELANHPRWTASAYRTTHPSKAPQHDRTPSVWNSHHASLKFAWTFPPHVRWWVCSTISLHGIVNSHREVQRHPAPPRYPPL